LFQLGILPWCTSSLVFDASLFDEIFSSVKVKNSETGKRSIAHFYRDCEIWPRLDPSAVLAPAPRPLQCTTSKSLFMGGSGNVRLTALLSRLYWVAGQRCYVKMIVNNNTKRTIKSLTLNLVRKITVFRPRPELEAGTIGDPDACHTATTYREVARTTLVMAQRASKGYASTKGWWTGVDPGERLEFLHFILLPVRAFRSHICYSRLTDYQPESLSVMRSRLLEVEYCIRASISAGPLTNDVFVDLPIRIISFMSIDVPGSSSSVSPFHASYRRSPSSSVQTNSIDGSLTTQSRSKSDIGSLTKDKNLGRELMNSRSLSTGGIHTAYDLCDIEPCESDHLEADVNQELGNLHDADDSDEEVNFVVGTATIGQAENHPDSYTESSGIPRTLDENTAKEATYSAAGTSGTRRRSKTMSDVSRSRGTRSISFAARVQEKIRNTNTALDLQDHLRFSDAEVDTPKPNSGWSKSTSKASTIVPSFDYLDGSSPSTCSVYTNPTVYGELTPSTANFRHSQVTNNSSSASGPNLSTELKSTSISDLGIKVKSITERAEALKQSISSNGVMNESDHGAADKTALVDRTSEVKRRIEALEAKMRNS
jgi:Arrestin (or S-antigen), C-terminal domain